mmetsp:Transcript_77104/g.220850  ORF Transcript_77104/g.220850 Transcript_77104/m.220850 type:complete len:243 (-) Transcript_77104:2255-2983(-)
MTSSRFFLSTERTSFFSFRLFSKVWCEFSTDSALSSSLACSALSFSRVFSASAFSLRAVLALASACLECLTMLSESSRAFLTWRLASSLCFVASSSSALATFSSSPPMFMIWLCNSRTSSSTVWCFCWMSFSSSSRDLMSFSSSFNFDFSDELSWGTFRDFRRVSYASICFLMLLTSMLAFCSRKSNSLISLSVNCKASSSACFSCRMALSLWLAFSYSPMSNLTSSGLYKHKEARMPPFCT